MLKIYYYGDIGDYDTDSPEYATDQKGAVEYLTELAQSHGLLPDLPGETIDLLVNTGLITQRDGLWGLAFPFFLTQDVALIDEIMENPVSELSEQVIGERVWLYEQVESLAVHYFNSERILYHCLCDDVFDGTAFDWLESQMCCSKRQPVGRDYLPIAFDDSPELMRISDSLLCSSHNLSVGDIVWNSFGDGNGVRRDMYRMIRTVSKSPERLTEFVGYGYEWFLDDKEASVSGLSHFYEKLITQKCGNFTETDTKMAALLHELGYLDGENLPSVPVFDSCMKEVVDRITARIMPLAEKQYSSILTALLSGKVHLSSLKHNIPVYELGNELWHQLLGRVNEELALSGLVSAPIYKEGEGRYYKSVKIHKRTY